MWRRANSRESAPHGRRLRQAEPTKEQRLVWPKMRQVIREIANDAAAPMAPVTTDMIPDQGFRLFRDRPAGNSIAGVARGIAHQIVRPGVDHQGRRAVRFDREIQHVTGMRLVLVGLLAP
jgi:hypothetical protein